MYGTERHGEAGAGASLVDMSAFVDLADKICADMRAENGELRAEMKLEKEQMLEELRAQNDELRQKLAPAVVVTDEQLAALEARLEALLLWLRVCCEQCGGEGAQAGSAERGGAEGRHVRAADAAQVCVTRGPNTAQRVCNQPPGPWYNAYILVRNMFGPL